MGQIPHLHSAEAHLEINIIYNLYIYQILFVAVVVFSPLLPKYSPVKSFKHRQKYQFECKMQV